MSLKSAIKDGKGKGYLTRVSVAGELTIGGYSNSTSTFQYIDTTATAWNFYGPKAGYNFIITAIILSSSGSPNINIFEASSTTSTVVDRMLLNINLTGVGAGVYILPFPFGGFLSVTEGEFVNVTISTTTIRMTILGYYRPIK
jgi:hypothetical protein